MRPTLLGNALEYSDQRGEIFLGNRTTRMWESAWKDQREGSGERERMKSHWGLWRDVKERDSLRGNKSMSVMQIRRGVMSNSKPQRTEYPRVQGHRASHARWVTSNQLPTGWWGGLRQWQSGEQRPSLMSLLLVQMMTVFSQPQDSTSFATHSAVFMPILNVFAVKFQWFKCELFSIKKFGWPYKM